MDNKETRIIIKESTQTYGVLSIAFGFVGIFILSPILSPLAFILGVVSIVKKEEFVLGIIGIFFAVIGVLTSPILLALFHSATITYIDVEKGTIL